MFGDAVSGQFRRRIKRKASLLPVRVSPKRKIKKSAVNKRTCGVNSSLLKTKKNFSKVGRENNLDESLKLESKIFTQTSSNLKPVARKSHRISIPKIYDKQRKIKHSLKTSTNNKVSLKKLELLNNTKTVSKKKNWKKVVNEEKQSTRRRSSRLSISSPSKEKGKKKELSESDLKPSVKTRPSQKKSTKQVTTFSSESVLTQNPGKSTLTPILLERRKSAKLSTEPRNQEISIHASPSKSFAATPVPGEASHISKLSGNRKSKSVLTQNPGKGALTPKLLERKKSARLSTEPRNQEISIHTPRSKSFAATPVPGEVSHISKLSGNRKSKSVLTQNPGKGALTPKFLERRKSARLSTEPRNQEISIHTPGSKSFAATKVPGEVSCISKLSGNRKSKSVFTPIPEKSTHTPKLFERKKSARRPTESRNQEISVHTPASKSFAVTPVPGKVTRISKLSGNKKSGRGSKEQNRSRIMNSEISERDLNSFQSPFETPLPERHSEKRKSSRLLESGPLKTLNKELPLCTPASLPTRNPDSILNKSSKSYKSVELLSPVSRSRKQSRPKVSNKDGSTVSHKKRKQKLKVNQHQKTSGNFKKPLSNETENLLVDVLTTPAFKLPIGRSLSKKYLSKADSKSSKRKLNASASENQVTSEELLDAKKRKSADFQKIPAKGTLKHKRWLLDNLKEKNGNYEDDIFENRSFDLYNSAFHFGDESDGSSVNIATPKFDCILTPALPKKTPRFKDCISPTEFLQARKTAEEYLYRRNKKRKSGDRPSSGKKASVNQKNTAQEIPEKKKLDFDEAVNKLIAVQKNLEIEAEVDDEEEDFYFSDASN